jgi:hypothetical protein
MGRVTLQQSPHKQARCSKCHNWYDAQRVAHVACPACLYTTARCRNCGGAEGALRSVFAHFTYWRVRAGGDGGHQKRISEWVKDTLRKLYDRS